MDILFSEIDLVIFDSPGSSTVEVLVPAPRLSLRLKSNDFKKLLEPNPSYCRESMRKWDLAIMNRRVGTSHISQFVSEPEELMLSWRSHGGLGKWLEDFVFLRRQGH